MARGESYTVQKGRDWTVGELIDALSSFKRDLPVTVRDVRFGTYKVDRVTSNLQQWREEEAHVSKKPDHVDVRIIIKF